MSLKATVNGMVFTFPDNTTNEQIGEAIDSYFHSAPKATENNGWTNFKGWEDAAESLPKDAALALVGTRDKADWNHPFNYLSPWANAGDAGAEDISKAKQVQQAGDIATSVGAWTTGEGLVDAGLNMLPGAGGVAGAAEKLGQFALKNAGGSVASQVSEGDIPSAGRTVEDILISGGTHGLIRGTSGIISGLGKVAKESEMEAARAVAGSEDAETRRILSRLSPEALGKALTQQGEARDALIRDIAKQTNQNFDELKAAIGAASGNSEKPMVEIAKRGLRGDTDELVQAAQINEDRVQIAKELGLNPDAIPLSFLSDNRLFIEFYQAMRNMPAHKFSPIELEAMAKISELGDDMIAEFGGLTDLSELDQNMREEHADLIDALQTQADGAYESVMSHIPVQTEAPISNTLKAIRDESMKLGGRENLLSPASKAILKDLSPIRLEDGTIINPTIGAVDVVRKDIGRAIGEQSGPYRTGERGQLKFLYDALSEDMDRTFGRLGVDGDINKARELVAKRKELEAQSVNLYGRTLANSFTPKLKTAVTSATKGDATKIANLMKSLLPEQRKAAAISGLHYLFNAGSKGGDGALSIKGFVDGYEALERNKVAKNEWLQYVPKELKDKLNKFYIFAKGANDALTAVPKTGVTATLSREFAAADTLAEKIISGDVSKKSTLIDKVLTHTPLVNGVWGLTKGTAKLAAGELAGIAPEERAGKALDMLASPEFRADAMQYGKRKTASKLAITKAEDALKRSAKYKAWYGTLSTAEKNLIDRIGPYKTFAYWAALQYGRDKLDEPGEARITIDKGYNDK